MNSMKPQKQVKTLQQYEIFTDTLLGKGAFGYVYLGKDTKQQKNVAVKQISLKQFSSKPERIVPTLKNEIKNMHLLNHKNIVQLYNVIKTENNLYIIVEYCNSGSLAQVINQRNQTEERCVMIMQQIVDGFRCLNRNNIVHRDLKPENILMHDTNTVKIADFGFSKVVENGMEEQTLVSFVGTPLYMSPQVLQKQSYSSKTDIWSIGMIFYELLYGRRAWEGKGFYALMENILNKPLQFPSVPRIHNETKAIIQRMLQLKEEDRISWEQLFEFFSPKSLISIYKEFASVRELSEQHTLNELSNSQKKDQSQGQSSSSLKLSESSNTKESRYRKNQELLNLYAANEDTRNRSVPQSPISVLSLKSQQSMKENTTTVAADFQKQFQQEEVVSTQSRAEDNSDATITTTHQTRLDEESTSSQKSSSSNRSSSSGSQTKKNHFQFSKGIKVNEEAGGVVRGNAARKSDNRIEVTEFNLAVGQVKYKQKENPSDNNEINKNKLMEVFNNKDSKPIQHFQSLIQMQQFINRSRGNKITIGEVKNMVQEHSNQRDCQNQVLNTQEVVHQTEASLQQKQESGLEKNSNSDQVPNGNREILLKEKQQQQEQIIGMQMGINSEDILEHQEKYFNHVMIPSMFNAGGKMVANLGGIMIPQLSTAVGGIHKIPSSFQGTGIACVGSKLQYQRSQPLLQSQQQLQVLRKSSQNFNLDGID